MLEVWLQTLTLQNHQRPLGTGLSLRGTRNGRSCLTQGPDALFCWFLVFLFLVETQGPVSSTLQLKQTEDAISSEDEKLLPRATTVRLWYPLGKLFPRQNSGGEHLETTP